MFPNCKCPTSEIPLQPVQQSGWSVSRFTSRHRAAILSDIIISEKLKLLQINYLAQKVDVLFNFLLGNIVLVTELMYKPPQNIPKTQHT